ncbi:Palmitoyltransferase [Pleurostoma richardsiae]|uniref:Palmitoyltransferase n=1 Tax=Pleurostoma richardsiae TaxID=41990 RepID=A0AA38VF91_9PEZI|nr:Palmitoyltransferase [Pleurostoma richardsiae]
MARRLLRRSERLCCSLFTYFPLVFVYGLTTWALFVLISIGSVTTKSPWIGKWSSIVGTSLYLMLNWCYTTAVFTPPGSTTNDNGYSTLPTHAPPTATSFTVKANGETRFCKKCQARKPDRAHHCSTCRRCVLKMDHHCPWLATCIGLRNHKPFLLFLMYTTVYCFFCFAVSGSWVWAELVNNTTYVDTIMPINYIILSVISGIIGLVVGAFTAWHILLASRGQTTIECLEKTRYLSPLRKSLRHAYDVQHTAGQGVNLPRYGQQLLDIHQNAIPGITRPEEGEELRSTTPSYDSSSPGTPSRALSYEELERYRARKRYEEYLDEQDSAKLPNAFDLGAKRNLLHLFGPNPWLWALPVCNTTGDGWNWEPSPKWTEARECIRRERDAQRAREAAAGWGGDEAVPAYTPTNPPWTTTYAETPASRARQQQQHLRPNGASSGGDAISPGHPPSSGGRRTPSKADRVLGRDPNLYADDPAGGGLNMRRLSPAGREFRGGDADDDLFDTSSDEEAAAAAAAAHAAHAAAEARAEAEHRAMNIVTNGAWARSGASGLLRKGSPNSSGSQSRGPAAEDDGVD